MSYKSILVPLDGSEADDRALACAYQIAKLCNSHLNVLHVQADSKEAVPLLGEGMSGAMIEEMIDLADRDADERSKLAHQKFDKFVADTGVTVLERPVGEESYNSPSVHWVEKIGREDEIVSRGGRISDLTIMARPNSDTERPSLMTLHAAIFETGKPVLIVPPEMPTEMGKRILVAWNGTSEAAAAVAAALPFLKHAEAITVLTIETEKAINRISGEELLRNLAWHGVKATTLGVSPGAESVGAIILAQGEQMNADLLVTGAYTHSRLIQIILGGVTRHLIAEAKIPVLAAH
ncbi:MAG: universal stress protein [Rhodospirillaceae bacterium]|nr:universal stress protein [Rhodospirillaceae bacterium]